MMMRISFLILTVAVLVGGASGAGQASVVGEPQCYTSVLITDQSGGQLVGFTQRVKTHPGRGLGLFPNPFCNQFANLKIRLTGPDNYSKLMLQRADSVSLGVQQGSTMSPSGPITFVHWQITNLRADGKDVPQNMLPVVEVDILNLVND